MLEAALTLEESSGPASFADLVRSQEFDGIAAGGDDPRSSHGGEAKLAVGVRRRDQRRHRQPVKWVWLSVSRTG